MDCRNFITNLSKVAAGLTFLCFLPTLQAAGREKVNFSDGWRFALVNDAGMESSDYQEGAGLPAVRLPHTWNVKDTFDDEPSYYRGIGWYRKNFEVPTAWAGKRIILRFEGACQVATVWVNNILRALAKGPLHLSSLTSLAWFGRAGRTSSPSRWIIAGAVTSPP